jgi:Cu-Zn family superoxide dismutase
MPILAGHRNIAAAATSALAAASCVARNSACSSPQHGTTTQGTTPAIWTGSSGPASHSEHPGASGTSGTSGTSAAPAGGQTLSAVLKAPDGSEVATAKFEFNNGYATVTVTTTGKQLTPGFHGMHLHKVGKCEADSVAPGTEGPRGDFLSAGGHFQAPGHSGHASGDLTSLQVRKDGGALLVTTTDGFTMQDLLAGEKTAIIIHAGADNFMNIPDRYKQANGASGPDETTMSTGDAGKRVACGVIGTG